MNPFARIEQVNVEKKKQSIRIDICCWAKIEIQNISHSTYNYFLNRLTFSNKTVLLHRSSTTRITSFSFGKASGEAETKMNGNLTLLEHWIYDVEERKWTNFHNFEKDESDERCKKIFALLFAAEEMIKAE